jgi:hypothetical protein
MVMYVENNYPFQFLLHITHDKINMYIIFARGFDSGLGFFCARGSRWKYFQIFHPKNRYNGFSKKHQKNGVYSRLVNKPTVIVIY